MNTSFSREVFIFSNIVVNKFRMNFDVGFNDGYTSIMRRINVTNRSVCEEDNGSHALSVYSEKW